MASCLPHPIPNPSRPGESLKAAPWHLLAISAKSVLLSASAVREEEMEVEDEVGEEEDEGEKEPKSKQTKGLSLCINRGNWEQVRPNDAINVFAHIKSGFTSQTWMLKKKKKKIFIIIIISSIKRKIVRFLFE